MQSFYVDIFLLFFYIDHFCIFYVTLLAEIKLLRCIILKLN